MGDRASEFRLAASPPPSLALPCFSSAANIQQRALCDVLQSG